MRTDQLRLSVSGAPKCASMRGFMPAPRVASLNTVKWLMTMRMGGMRMGRMRTTRLTDEIAAVWRRGGCYEAVLENMDQRR